MRIPCWLRLLFGWRCATPRPVTNVTLNINRRRFGGRIVSTATITWTLPTTRTDTPPTPLAPSEIAGIEVWDAVNGAAAVKIGEAMGAATSFTTGPLAGGTHVFTMIVVDTVGDDSAASAPASGSVPLAPPSPVTGVTVTINP
jgi:hypothetical protein